LTGRIAIRVGPVGEQGDAAGQQEQVPALPPGPEGEQAADQRQASLHQLAARVTRPPLRQRRRIVELHAGRMLGHRNVECRARKGSGGEQGERADQGGHCGAAVAAG
jgi:hypothetical protein